MCGEIGWCWPKGNPAGCLRHPHQKRTRHSSQGGCQIAPSINIFAFFQENEKEMTSVNKISKNLAVTLSDFKQILIIFYPVLGTTALINFMKLIRSSEFFKYYLIVKQVAFSYF